MLSIHPEPRECQRNEADAIRVIVADDHALVSHAVAAVMESMPGIEVLGRTTSPQELLAMVAGEQPDIVVTEVNRPGLDGIELTATIRARHPRVKVLVLSMYEDAQVIRRAVQGGASGYVVKGAAPEELEAALWTLVRTGSYFSAEVARRLLQRQPPTPEDELTPRQLEILRLIAQGKCSKQIGSELGLSFKTVDVHRVRMATRLGINTVADLTRYALRHGLVQP